MPEQLFTIAKPPKWTAHLFERNVLDGSFGWWYRFWWRVLLGARFEKTPRGPLTKEGEG